MEIEERLRNIEGRLKRLEGAVFPTMWITDVLGQDEKGQLIFGKRRKMKNATPGGR